MGRSGGPREDRLVQLVRASLGRVGLSADSSVQVGFSGGRDSTVLLAVLRPVVRNLQAVHVDHAVRAESAADAERAQVLADRFGVPLTVRRLDADSAARHPGVGLEEALRRERYLAFAAVADAAGAEVVALGHHAQDQAETVLLHLLRGAGLSGAVGMRERSVMAVPWWGDAARRDLALWRPLIGVEQRELDGYLSWLGVDAIEDASNADRRFRRNAIRHDVLPLLESISPGATGNLARFGSLVSDDEAFLEELAAGLVGDDVELDRAVVIGQHVAIRRRMVRQWLAHHVGDVEVPRQRIDAVLDALVANRGATIEIGGGVSVEIRRGRARVAHR